VAIATLLEFDNKRMTSSLPVVTNILVTLSDFLTTYFTLKRTQRMALKKMPEVIIKLDKILQD
jgi:hypothetical protein